MMPTYEYHCLACNQDFEAYHGMNEPAPYCPACGGAVKQRLSAPAIHGYKARGREAAMQSLQDENPRTCGCGRPRGCHSH
ncbi:FmdB family zinc ribbon protein [Nitrosococcus halophilus]|nr:zinc ribbon domain-containing protein [Nitrosococcus halophilus]